MKKKRVDIVKIHMVKEKSLHYANRKILSPAHAAQLFSDYLGPVDREYFVVVCLDTKNQPTNITTAHIGSLNASVVAPREVFKTAILSNAASIIVGHVHPSGSTKESEEDLIVTENLIKGGKLLGVPVVDHIILGDDGVFKSLREDSMLPF